jgi:hypothetical protein
MSGEKKYRQVEELRTESGLVATISAREGHLGAEVFSFAVRKEYERSGEVQQTAWMQRHHLGELRELLVRVDAAMTAAEDKSREAVRRRVSSK